VRRSSNQIKQMKPNEDDGDGDGEVEGSGKRTKLSGNDRRSTQLN